MIDLILNVRRRFWYDVSTDAVQTYLEELTKFKDELDNMSFTYTHNLFGSDALLKEINELIGKEIKLCSFYHEYQNRRESEPNFNQWVFTAKEDVKTLFPWNVPDGGQWTKTNGKIKAIIQFDRSGKMVKITLNYENDSSTLTFIDRHNEKGVPKPVHLKNEDSIANKVEAFKMMADTFLLENEYPQYCSEKTSIDVLNKLLWIDDSVDSKELRRPPK